MKSAEVPTVPSFYKLLILSNPVKLPLTNLKEKCRSADSAGFWQTLFFIKNSKTIFKQSWVLGACAAGLQGCLVARLLGCFVRRVRAYPTGPGISDGPGPVIPCSLLPRVNGESLLAIEHGLPLFAAHRTLGLRALRSATWGPRALSTGCPFFAAHRTFRIASICQRRGSFGY